MREIILNYLYVRNQTARSDRSDKTGSAVKISAMRRDLKESHALSQTDIRSNLTYLISEGWVDKEPYVRTVKSPRGGMFPSSTDYYRITAAGIDKIEGPGEFTMDKFHGIKIEAAGHNVITVGDGNQVNAVFADLAQEFAELKDDLRASAMLTPEDKINAIGDIDSIQSQLAKPKPNKTVISALWRGIEKVAVAAGLADRTLRIGAYLLSVLP